MEEIIKKGLVGKLSDISRHKPGQPLMGAEKKENIKERRIWYFPCEGCGRQRAQSHKKKNASGHLCANCRKKEEIEENQATLFDAMDKEVESRAMSHFLNNPHPLIVTIQMASLMAARGMLDIEQIERAKQSDDGHLKGNFYLDKKLPTDMKL